MKNVVFYHKNCTDGFGAAYAAWASLGDKDTQYIPIQYNDARSVQALNTLVTINPDDHVYVLDFSFPREVTDWLLKNTSLFVWLDHHKSALGTWSPHSTQPYHSEVADGIGASQRVKSKILIDYSKSGAMLAWEHFHPGVPNPMLLSYIDDRDRWAFNFPGSKELHVGLALMKPWTFKQWQVICSDLLQPIIQDGAIVLKFTATQIADSKARAKPVTVNGVSGLHVNCSHNISELGHELAKESGTFGLVWSFSDPQTIICSFRSIDNFDVSTIANSYGGGGHKNAAGCSVDIATFLSWL